jgi:hypothetical protein
VRDRFNRSAITKIVTKASAKCGPVKRRALLGSFPQQS